jgi:hypothetical protein
VDAVNAVLVLLVSLFDSVFSSLIVSPLLANAGILVAFNALIPATTLF